MRSETDNSLIMFTRSRIKFIPCCVGDGLLFCAEERDKSSLSHTNGLGVWHVQELGWGPCNFPDALIVPCSPPRNQKGTLISKPDNVRTLTESFGELMFKKKPRVQRAHVCQPDSAIALSLEVMMLN